MSTVVDPDTNEHEAAVVEREHETPIAEPEVLTCPNCGAPADDGQLMCLECGSRLALDYQRPPSWRLPAAVVGLVLLLAGIGVVIALAAVTSNADKATATAPPAQPAPAAATPQTAPADTAPTSSTPTPAPTGSTPTPTPTPAGGAAPTDTTATATPATPATPAPAAGWPPGKSAFTVIIASMPSKAAADDKLKAAQAAGITGAAILHSDDFPTLNPGYWVVFDGQYDTIDQAKTQAAADRGKGDFGDAYPRFVSKDPNAKP